MPEFPAPAVGERQSAHIEDVLRHVGLYVCVAEGMSMRPMLRGGRDVVVIRARRQGEPLRRGDVALYRHGSRFVLHRVVRVVDDHDDGAADADDIAVADGHARGDFRTMAAQTSRSARYVLRGDRMMLEEHVRDDQIIGMLTQWYRGNRCIEVTSLWYALYWRVWLLTYPMRHALHRAARYCRRAVHAMRTMWQ